MSQGHTTRTRAHTKRPAALLHVPKEVHHAIEGVGGQFVVVAHCLVHPNQLVQNLAASKLIGEARKGMMAICINNINNNNDNNTHTHTRARAPATNLHLSVIPRHVIRRNVGPKFRHGFVILPRSMRGKQQAGSAEG